jgi:hypothetical protein
VGIVASSRQIFRQTIPVDDQWHVIELSTPIVHVASRAENSVEVWFINIPWADTRLYAFRVFGTGQPLPPVADRHVGTAITPSGQLVWHLMEHQRPYEDTFDGGAR